MIPRQLLETATTPSGEPITLAREGGHFVVRTRGVTLMSSAAHHSEEEMATIACTPLGATEAARVLIGGLGMGFTLRRALDVLGADAHVTAVELVPAIVAWNRGALAELAGRPLDDRRVEVVVGDVATTLRGGAGGFDAALLDVDNGPDALTAADNRWLYTVQGLRTLGEALRPGGMAVIWSAFRSAPFEERLGIAGFEVQIVRARGREGRGARHTLYVLRRPVRQASVPRPARPRPGPGPRPRNASKRR